MVMIEKNFRTAEKEERPVKTPVIETDRIRPRRRGRRKIGCCLFFLLIVLAAVGSLLWLAAATGLVTVPAVSTLAYQAPEPLHEVADGPPLEVYLSENLSALLTQRLQAGGGTLEDRSVELSLPEASITESFRSVLRQNELTWFETDSVQVAVDDSGIEVFLPLAASSNNNALVLFFEPGAENGLVTVDAVQVSLGSFSLPSWATETVLLPLLRQGLDLVNQQVGRYVSVEKIETLMGQLVVSGVLIVELLNLN